MTEQGVNAEQVDDDRAGGDCRAEGLWCQRRGTMAEKVEE